MAREAREAAEKALAALNSAQREGPASLEPSERLQAEH